MRCKIIEHILGRLYALFHIKRYSLVVTLSLSLLSLLSLSSLKQKEEKFATKCAENGMLLGIRSSVDPPNICPCGLCVGQSLFSSLFVNNAKKVLCQGFVNFNNTNNSNKKLFPILYFCVRLLNRVRLHTFVNHIMCFSIWIFIKDSLRFLFQGRGFACQRKKEEKRFLRMYLPYVEFFFPWTVVKSTHSNTLMLLFIFIWIGQIQQ